MVDDRMQSPLGLAGPAWPGVRMLSSTRAGGVSAAPYGTLNLGTHVEDDPRAVAENRRRLQTLLPAEPVWLDQVHGTAVLDADGVGTLPEEGGPPRADAAVTRQAGRVLAIMTADCLPVVIAAHDASVLGVAHAGWRGLADGVLENTVRAMGDPHSMPLRAWIGPAIGPGAYEVGDEVRQRFVDIDPAWHRAFAPSPRSTAAAPKWFADLPALARERLLRAGVQTVASSGWCTVADAERFFSYRRDGRTGRQATLAWLAPTPR